MEVDEERKEKPPALQVVATPDPIPTPAPAPVKPQPGTSRSVPQYSTESFERKPENQRIG